MVKYYQRIPQSAIIRELDGNDYGIADCVMYWNDGKKYHIKSGEIRMLRVAFVQHGEAFLYLGCAGSAIADTNNLPFNVTAIQR